MRSKAAGGAVDQGARAQAKLPLPPGLLPYPTHSQGVSPRSWFGAQAPSPRRLLPPLRRTNEVFLRASPVANFRKDTGDLYAKAWETFGAWQA
jgi:hypothetical protein